MDGMLSQEEINALLNGMSSEESAPTSQATETLTAEEIDAVGEIGNISMGTAATTLFSLVNKRVTITTPVVSYSNWNEVASNYDKPCVFIQISYRDGLDGKNILILKERDVKVITDLMMGGDGTNIEGELSELHVSAICEAMNQMMGSSATSLSSMLNKTIDISPPIANVVDLNESIEDEMIASFLTEQFVRISFRMEIEGLVDSDIMQLYPVGFARELYNNFMASVSFDKTPVQDAVQPQIAPQVQQMPPQHQPVQQPGDININPETMYQPNPAGYMQQPYMQPAPQNVQPAQFQTFTNVVNYPGTPENIDIIKDVPLEVTVELGRASKSIQEILEFAPGTIIELNRIAGEPIDVLVNGKHVAKGEVVVIEESFGIRVTEIIK